MRKNIFKTMGTTLMLSAALSLGVCGFAQPATVFAEEDNMKIGDLDNDGEYTMVDCYKLGNQITGYAYGVQLGDTSCYLEKADLDCDNDNDDDDYAILKQLVNEAGYQCLGDMDGDEIYTSVDKYRLGNQITGYTYGVQLGDTSCYSAKADLDCDGDNDEEDMAILEDKMTLGDLNGDGAYTYDDQYDMGMAVRYYAIGQAEKKYQYVPKADFDFDGDNDSTDYDLFLKLTGME